MRGKCSKSFDDQLIQERHVDDEQLPVNDD